MSKKKFMRGFIGEREREKGGKTDEEEDSETILIDELKNQRDVVC
jgi:hypothetical protein